MGDRREPFSLRFKLFIGAIQLFIVVELIRWAWHSPAPLGTWICICGFLVSCPAGWFSREGKVRWTLGEPE